MIYTVVTFFQPSLLSLSHLPSLYSTPPRDAPTENVVNGWLAGRHTAVIDSLFAETNKTYKKKQIDQPIMHAISCFFDLENVCTNILQTWLESPTTSLSLLLKWTEESIFMQVEVFVNFLIKEHMILRKIDRKTMFLVILFLEENTGIDWSNELLLFSDLFSIYMVNKTTNGLLLKQGIHHLFLFSIPEARMELLKIPYLLFGIMFQQDWSFLYWIHQRGCQFTGMEEFIHLSTWAAAYFHLSVPSDHHQNEKLSNLLASLSWFSKNIRPLSFHNDSSMIVNLITFPQQFDIVVDLSMFGIIPIS